MPDKDSSQEASNRTSAPTSPGTASVSSSVKQTPGCPPCRAAAGTNKGNTVVRPAPAAAESVWGRRVALSHLPAPRTPGTVLTPPLQHWKSRGKGWGEGGEHLPPPCSDLPSPPSPHTRGLKVQPQANCQPRPCPPGLTLGAEGAPDLLHCTRRGDDTTQVSSPHPAAPPRLGCFPLLPQLQRMCTLDIPLVAPQDHRPGVRKCFDVSVSCFPRGPSCPTSRPQEISPTVSLALIRALPVVGQRWEKRRPVPGLDGWASGHPLKAFFLTRTPILPSGK